MALYATNRYPGDGVTTQYEINFLGGYLQKTHVKAYTEDQITLARSPVTLNPGQFINDYTIGGFPPVPVGRNMVIYRETPRQTLVDFVNTSRITEANLDLVARQGLFVAVEALDGVNSDLLAAFLASVGAVDDAVVAAQAAQLQAEFAATQAELHRADALAAALEVAADKVEVQGLVADAEGHALRAFNYAADASAARTLASFHSNTASFARTAAETAQAAALESAQYAQAAEAVAVAQGALSTSNAALSTAAAADAVAAQAQALAIQASLAGGTVGFDNTAYDWGSVTDPSTYFNRDFGSI